MIQSLQSELHDNAETPPWTAAQVQALFEAPFNDLLFQAQSVHREHFDPNQVQLSALLSIKTGGCPEDCGYCPQSAHHAADLEAGKLMDTADIIAAAREAKAAGATRFCMGAAWRSPRDSDLSRVMEAVAAVKALGLETCATLGMLTAGQARRLKASGLDYYNHNLDTSADYYREIITTRSYQDRLDTLEQVRGSGMQLCCCGIIGMGESRVDRATLIATLANLPEPPQSVPVNMLVPVPGTPLQDAAPVEPFELVRTIAAARITMPASHVRLSAGRSGMPDELQALCFFAGANSIFYGDRLLTTGNASVDHDRELFARLGLRPERASGAGSG
jgi:biotin synthase